MPVQCGAAWSLIRKIRRIEGKAMIIMNSDISYEQVLCQYQVPAVDQFIADLSRKTMLKIYCNTNHPLSFVIKRKTTRQTRVSKLIQMPKCRTEKLKRSFSIIFLIFRYLCVTFSCRPAIFEYLTLFSLFYYYCNSLPCIAIRLV